MIMRNCGIKVLTQNNLCSFSIPKSHQITNPLTKDIIHEEEYLTYKQIKPFIEKKLQVQNEWKNVPLEERISQVRTIADYFQNNCSTIAAQLTDTIGKPIIESESEILVTSDMIHKMCNFATEELSEQVILKNKLIQKSIIKEPIGVAFIISSWNYPFYGPATLLAPALLAGNTVVIKPSQHSAQLGRVFEEASKQIKFPLIKSALLSFQTCEEVIRMDEVGICQFIGTSENGKKILAEASHSSLHKVILELEGKDAAYVDQSCEIQRSAQRLVQGIYQNAGQSCYSIQRIYIHEKISDDFIQAMLNEINKLQLGDPKERNIKLGPIKLEENIDVMQKYCNEAVSLGGKLLIGGQKQKIDPYKGLFYQPTVVLNPPRDCNMMQKETFGPICAIQVVKSVDDAIERINSCQYSLTSAVFAEDPAVIEFIEDKLNVGTVYLNKCLQVHPSLPWSGRKLSGKSFTLSKNVFDNVTELKSLHFIL